MSRTYHLQAWLAVLTLALFLAAYFGLAAWFLLTAWRLTVGSNGAGHLGGWIVGACAAFLAVFMLKAVLFVKHGGGEHRVEITPAQQPELFHFLHQLADTAGAPKPHKVFVSPQVNAAVFYDLSVLNLFLPSRKNLEIGLGLVNALTLGEFRAVLAHEFGHFAQRAMAVGRWVYVAQQIAAHLVARRDKLDEFLVGLSRFDVRIAWVGWVLRLVVWSIRSLVDSVFRGVLIVQRALSRQMEFNADLVAVSLTGSDALVHALYKLESADDAWNRALAFVLAEKARGRLAPDLFALQSQVVDEMGQLLGDPQYGRVPAAAVAEPASHRLFKVAMTQPPQMWLSHPLNHDREENAKRHYVAAPIDERPAWALFADAQGLREAVTARLLGQAPAEARPHEDPLGELNRQYRRTCFEARYRGVYFGRSAVRCVDSVDALYEPLASASPEALDALYSEGLAVEMESLRTLQKEQAQLEGLKAGTVQAPGGVIQHRGRTLQRRELPAALAAVGQELDAVQQRLQAHDRRCRGLHLAAARQLGAGWPEHLQGLLAALHFAEHSEADLRDLQGRLSNTVAVETATHKVSQKGVTRIVLDANALRDALGKLFDGAARVQLGAPLLERLGAESWAAALGELKLPYADAGNLSQWLGAAGSWVDHAVGAFASLRIGSLELLLQAENRVAQHLREATPAEAAPPAAVVPAGYATLPYGAERPRQQPLGWWGRFQTADGVLPASARIAVAGGIVAAVLGLGGSVGSASITAFNGLGRSVSVRIGTQPAFTLPPGGHLEREFDADQTLRIETRTTEGALVESFDAPVGGAFGHFIYNVGSAAPLVEWTAVYGSYTAPPERRLGVPRWSSTRAEVVFTEPPRSINSKSGGGTRLVLSAPAEAAPSHQLDLLPNAADRATLAGAHARWDPTDAPRLVQWLWLARTEPGFAALLKARLDEAPGDLLLLRMEQDSASPERRAELCDRARAAAAVAAEAGTAYLAARCLPEGPPKDQAFLDGHARHPDHGWFAYAAAYVEAGQARWARAIAAAETARRRVPALREELTLELARMRRAASPGSGGPDLAELSNASAMLRQMLAIESGQGLERDPAARAYAELARGRLDSALQLARGNAQAEARLLRLAAASDRAAPELVQRALALSPTEGLDEQTVWASVGLAARAGRDLAPFEPAIDQAASFHAAAMRRFIAALRGREPAARAESLLAGLPPELRGQAYVIGAVALGERAPAAWREGARRLLFAPERPHFT